MEEVVYEPPVSRQNELVCDHSFWHHLKHNPSSNLKYWFEHLFKGVDPIIFWGYLSWNCPINDP